MSVRKTPRTVARGFVSGLIGSASLAAASCCGIADAARAQDGAALPEIETKYIFGFTEGSGVGDKGEREFEIQPNLGLGKRDGRFAASQTKIELEHTPTQFIQLELGALVSSQSIANVTGLDDRNAVGFGGLIGEFRYLLIERTPSSPLAVTLSLEPEWHSIDETSGAHVVNYALDTRINADVELLKDRAYLGFNLLYEPETTRAGMGVWQRESTGGVSAALALRIGPQVTIGAEADYLRHYEGIDFKTFTGDAVFVGPNVYVQITPKVFVMAAWTTQIAGHEPGVGSLDLTDFPRQRAKLRFGVEF